MKDRLLERAIVFTFLAHGLAMLLMAGILLRFVPGGGTDAERIARIAASPNLYRLGWFGWQITAVSDVVFAIALQRATKDGPARRAGIAQLVLVVLAVIPDQLAQFLLVTRGVDLATAAASSGDSREFLAFEATMFPLTSGWAALLYTLSAIGWAIALRTAQRWNRFLERLSPPMLLLFVAISVAPILPLAIRPSAEVIGAGNAIGFTILEVWFVAAFFAVLDHYELRDSFVEHTFDAVRQVECVDAKLRATTAHGICQRTGPPSCTIYVELKGKYGAPTGR